MGFCLNGPSPCRLKLYGNIFVSQIPTLIPGIKVEFSHSFRKEQQEKSNKTGWILVFFAQINRFSKFLFLDLVNQIYCFLNRSDWDFAQIVPCPR